MGQASELSGPPAVVADPANRVSLPRLLRNVVVIPLLLVVVGVLVWEGFAAAGSPPDPGDLASRHLSAWSVMINAGVLVFREGLEAVLVLAALTAGLTRTRRGFAKPVAIGSGLAFVASVATYFIVVGVLARLEATTHVGALNIQAATGLLAVAVLLVITNWFFHRIYWTGWITHHGRKKVELTRHGAGEAAFWGLVTVGFTAVYREGFEVAIMLQSWRLEAGDHVVVAGALLGLALTAIVGVLTFAAQYRLPYRKMLVFTGVMIGAVLLVMAGETVQEMQLAGWFGAHPLPWSYPDWVGTWFATFANWECLAGQVLAGAIAIGSYLGAQYVRVWRPRREALRAAERTGQPA